MARLIRLGWAASLLGLAGGCASAPPLDNPLLVRKAAEGIENPVLVSPGVPTARSYQDVFEKTIDILDDYFVIRSADPYDGRILTLPRIAPGYEQPWKPGNPGARERLLATLQTTRQTAAVTIRTGERGGYLVYVEVIREMEDLSKPARASVGAVFQESPTVDRQLDVIGPPMPTGRAWFVIGRDYALEQLILQRIRECQ
jgi:hypothetical protein